MKLRNLALVGAALALSLLVSCVIIVEPNPWPPSGAVNVSTGSDGEAQAPRTLANNEHVYYRLSNTGGSSGVVYVELNNGSTDFDLEVLSSGSGTVRYSSSSRFVFGSGASALGLSAAGELDQQAIVTSVTCRGACVIIPAGEFGSTMYAKVTNRSGSSQSVGVYFFKDVYKDSGEPANDSTSAPFLNLGDDFGAIETVGDVDYFNVLHDGNVTFNYINASGNNLAIRAEIRDALQNLVGTISPGQSFVLEAGDRIMVRADGSTFAGVSSSSGYRLSYPPLLVGADVVPRSVSE
ncbi:MAG: hypothetical protein KF813_04885 [Trueperaceae bacterium]|nr:hypothetical protein [Trueperaceae bacterium]